MIVVRDVFQLKFGKAKQARQEWKKGAKFLREAGVNKPRLMTDLVGQYYTLVLESTYPSLAAYEKAHLSAGGSKAWAAWYRRFTTLVESGYREIFTVVE
ncbi:MAG: NIPSNAP family protein [Candidatus Zixiibacteriota bacterium]